MAATTAADYLRDPEGITRRSFAIIRRETDVSTLPAGLVDVAYRMVHPSRHDRSGRGPGVVG